MDDKTRSCGLVDLAEPAMAPVAATESAVRGLLNVIRRK